MPVREAFILTHKGASVTCQDFSSSMHGNMQLSVYGRPQGPIPFEDFIQGKDFAPDNASKQGKSNCGYRPVCTMTDGAVRRSRRSRRPSRIMEEDFASTMAIEDEAEGDHSDAQNTSEQTDDASDSQSHPRKKRRTTSRRMTASRPREDQRDSASQQIRDRQPTNEQRAMKPLDLGTQALGTLLGSSNSRRTNTELDNRRLRTAAPKRKKQRYDPEPMKAVAEHAQDILGPVSQTNVPAAVNSCVVLNCKSSVPVR